MHFRTLLVRAAALAAVATLAACSDEATTAPRQAAGENPIDASIDVTADSDASMERRGWFPTIPQTEAIRAREALRLGGPTQFGDVSSAAQTYPILYHGGPIMHSANKVVAIYWGPNTIYTNGPTPGTVGSGNNDYSLLGYFMRNIGQTPYWKINQDYTDAQGRGVPNALYYTRFWANASNPGTAPSDAAIRNMIKSGFWSKYAPDVSTIYTVFTGPGVNLGGKFGVTDGYCAYHSKFSYFSNGFNYIIKYAVMPYAASKAICTSNLIENKSPNDNLGVDAEVSALAHELVETVTDPQFNAWYDAQSPGQENADKCAWKFGSTYTTPNGAKANIKVGVKHFLVQQNWKIGSSRLSQIGCAMN
ncbi:MAG: hypothetical protein IPG88_21615 [Gemmatimonadetes bacterium]|nr:hypothetical protein [Gemmatimonadota bacterium]